MDYKAILVSLDGSALAEEALPRAIDLAVTVGSTVLLLRAAEAHGFTGADATDAQVIAVHEAEAYLAGVREWVLRQGVADVQTAVWYGPAADAIVDAARFRKADLIVMSTHGRSGLGRLVLGSVAARVLHSTSTPTMLLRHGASPLGAASTRATSGTPRAQRVIVPLDGSPAAEAILPFLLQIAGPLDMRVVLIRVLEPIPPRAVELGPVIVEDVEGRRHDAEEYLAPIAAQLSRRGVDVRAEVRRGAPVAEILTAARETGADLIAMTTHGRSGLGRLLFGSVAEALLRGAGIPVFLMRQAAAQVRASEEEARR